MSIPQEMAYFLPVKYQKILHTVFWAIGLCLLATSAGFLAIAATLPKWLIFTQAAFGVLSTGAHYVAKSNVAPESPSAPR